MDNKEQLQSLPVEMITEHNKQGGQGRAGPKGGKNIWESSEAKRKTIYIA